MKNSKKGISLIVLVITIIVIIILAAAVILTLNNNNPIAEANDARYASDTANMQAVLTNTVAKIMAANQSTITITPTTIGDNELTKQIPYTLAYPTSEGNATGNIVFDAQSNASAMTNNLWYTGKKLPNYAAGTEQWSVDAEGNITLTVRYGSDNAKTYPSSGTVVDNGESGEGTGV